MDDKRLCSISSVPRDSKLKDCRSCFTFPTPCAPNFMSSLYFENFNILKRQISSLARQLEDASIDTSIRAMVVELRV
jgi:hypothetical protein